MADNGKKKAIDTSKRMTGAEAVVECLRAEGVDVIFGYPGGQVIRIYDVLYTAESPRHILARHEQAAVHEADGYARATGKVGVALVTSGPGATNTVTGIATAYMDSIPLVVLTAQVPTSVIGSDSFQESDIFGITMPIVKHSYLLKSIDELPTTFWKAFHIARTGRPGPVLIDLPSDMLSREIDFEYPEYVEMPSYKPTFKGNKRQIRQAKELIAQAKRPVLCVGGGVVASGAYEEVLSFAELYDMPVVTTLMAKGAFPENHRLALGMCGMHGSIFANNALTECDLLVAVGARFSDRVTGDPDCFAPEASVIHIDIDPAEIGKNRKADVPIVGDAKLVLGEFIPEEGEAVEKQSTKAWLERIASWRKEFPFESFDYTDVGPGVDPNVLFAALSRALDPYSSIVTTEVGQHQMWAAQRLEREVPRTFLTSGGLGTMGFGLPAAIGAAIAAPDKTIVCVAGDGSLQMNIQEMATARAYDLPVKVLLVNNGSLGMVHQWQKLFYGARYSSTLLDYEPDYVKLAQAYGWQGRRIEANGDVESAIAEMLTADGPYLLDVAVSPECDVYPMVAPGASIQDPVTAADAAVGAVRHG